MNLVDPTEIIGDILKFKGFWKSPFKDKLKWLFVLYPFAVFIILYHMVLWIPVLPSIFWDKIRRNNK
jgi:hypothetical protein